MSDELRAAGASAESFGPIEKAPELRVGDEVAFGRHRYTLLERLGSFRETVWIAVETDNPLAVPRALAEKDLQEIPKEQG